MSTLFKKTALSALTLGFALVSFSHAGTHTASENTQSQPNVIFILTDDQGIGELSCHDNPWIKTPNMDQLHSESVRLTDFHATPYCAPTRAGLMTGKYCIRNGTWATYKGRDILSHTVKTFPEIFQANGYKTALFGKWHLGDNYPTRPTDRGFDHAVQHLAGGVGELSDHWGNGYFNDSYMVNNKPVPFEGYCTDVWFSEAMKFIESNKQNPFLIYLATNAPHSPWIVGEDYSEPYQTGAGKDYPSAEFYGMIANIDENLGKLMTYLDESGLANNTILVFMTDNGTSGGVSHDESLGYNCGLRGRKGKPYEGGHRVPFFIRWPQGGITGGRDISELTSHVDVFPTLLGLCDVDSGDWNRGDGIDLSGRLQGKSDKPTSSRTVFLHHRQDWRAPDPIKGSCIMRDKWRLVNGDELYNLETDLSQSTNVAARHPDMVVSMLKANREFIAETKELKVYQEFPYCIVGNDEQPLTVLTIQHAIGDSAGIWRVKDVLGGRLSKNAKHRIHIESPGTYTVTCSRFPPEYVADAITEVTPVEFDTVRLSIFDKQWEQPFNAETESVSYEIELPAGTTDLVANWINDTGIYGVNYVMLQKTN